MLRALELAPNEANTRHAYADYLMVMGDLEGSLNQVEIGHLYDPFSPMSRRVLDYHRLFMRQYDEIIKNCRKAITENPDSTVDLTVYREALWFKGMYEEAFEAYRKTWGRDAGLLQAMNEGYSESGYTGAIRSLADVLAERDPDYRDYVTLAEFYARADEAEKSLQSLEKAYQHRQPRILHTKANPTFDELRSSPAFQNLLHRIGFPDDAPR